MSVSVLTKIEVQTCVSVCSCVRVCVCVEVTHEKIGVKLGGKSVYKKIIMRVRGGGLKVCFLTWQTV